MAEDDQERGRENLGELAARFSDVAVRYCRFVEAMGELPPDERPTKATRLLTCLLAAATELPQQVDVTDAEVERVEAPKFDLGTFDFYYEVFDPFIRDELVIGSLSDDLADIYVDLREGIDLLAAGHTGDALWQWRFHYENHWGDHAADAVRALHRVITGRGRDISQDPEPA